MKPTRTQVTYDIVENFALRHDTASVQEEEMGKIMLQKNSYLVRGDYTGSNIRKWMYKKNFQTKDRMKRESDADVTLIGGRPVRPAIESSPIRGRENVGGNLEEMILDLRTKTQEQIQQLKSENELLRNDKESLRDEYKKIKYDFENLRKATVKLNADYENMRKDQEKLMSSLEEHLQERDKLKLQLNTTEGRLQYLEAISLQIETIANCFCGFGFYSGPRVPASANEGALTIIDVISGGTFVNIDKIAPRFAEHDDFDDDKVEDIVAKGSY
ncbi:unnamed protein product [Darwinula stevensoni]|uniref:Uncharacterized protein n=1 Tax=Darwinula stevensoni TaxID=69355 RepID=A0A7R8XHI3_9CRUS|nr:unnamed protein product [Darwinula stevensoni]CAG0890463.1 unnamed protein product [Darwinula stevensoni]